MSDSDTLFSLAQDIIPGGVNSPVRAFGSVGGTPVFLERGAGSRVYSVEGVEYIDFCGSWGPLILGHAHHDVVAAVSEAAANGMTFGASTEKEVRFAQQICDAIPAIDMVRLVSSGTEATMSALRLARGATGRNRILKFDGCYHGHADYLLVSAGSGLLTGGISSSAGVSPDLVEDVLVVPYNDLDSVKAVFAEYGADIAAVIVEPVAGNMGVVPPAEGFLEGLREVTRDAGSLLIFDEVITGFRMGPTTFSTIAGIEPDLICMGKIIGGGLPIGAFGGRRDVMEHLAPLESVYQAGTLSGNPVAVSAGMMTLELLQSLDPYPELALAGEKIREGLMQIGSQVGLPIHCQAMGGAFTLFFKEGSVCNLDDAKACDTERYAAYFHGMLERGIYLPPSQFEAAFVSAAHSADDVDAFLRAAEDVFTNVLQG